MLAHHAPTKHLLTQFATREPLSSRKSAIWVYEKGVTPRSTRDLKGECAEYGYFSGGSSDESDLQVDKRLADEYESPFNKILPRLNLLLPITRFEDKRVCSRYMAHLFRRSRAAKLAGRKLYERMCYEYRALSDDPDSLRIYAAKISILRRRPISINALRDAIQRVVLTQNNDQAAQTLFIDDLPRATDTTAAHLQQLDWMMLRSSSVEPFFISDTPVISKQVSRFGQTKFGVGINGSGVEWFIPVSARHLLRVGRGLRSTIDVSPNEAGDLNMGQALTMTKRMYGPSFSGWIDDLVQRWGGKETYFETVFHNPDQSEDDFDLLLALSPEQWHSSAGGPLTGAPLIAALPR